MQDNLTSDQKLKLRRLAVEMDAAIKNAKPAQWQTWDSFGGRMIDHTQDADDCQIRAIEAVLVGAGWAELDARNGAPKQEPSQVVRSGAGLGDAVVGVVTERDELRALTQEMLATLRVNLLRGTLRTDDDAFFERLLNKWSGWSPASPNDGIQRPVPAAGSSSQTTSTGTGSLR